MSSEETKQISYKNEKLAFSNWAVNWSSSNVIKTEKVAVDIIQISAILQTMGFKLDFIDFLPQNENSNDTTEVQIEIKCKKSGMRSVLSKSDLVCICPSSQKVSESQILTVSGTNPSCSQVNLKKVVETYSTLVPSIHKETSMVIQDVLSKLFEMVSVKDINQNEKEEPEPNLRNPLCKFRSLEELSKPTNVTENNWEVDPKTSPPISTSSPIPELSNSLSQISSNSDKEQALIDLMVNIKQNIDKALVLLPTKNSTFTKTNVKRVSNIKVSPTVITPTRSTTGTSTPDLPTRQTPVKKIQEEITPKSSVIGEKKHFQVKSKIGSFRKKTEITSTNIKIKIRDDQTTKLSPNIESKKMLGMIPKSSSLRGSNTNLSGVSGVKNKSAIPSFTSKSSTSKTGLIVPFNKLK